MKWPQDFPFRELHMLLKKIRIYPDDGCEEIVKSLNDHLQEEIDLGNISCIISISSESGTAISFLYISGQEAKKFNCDAAGLRRVKLNR